MSDSVLPTGWTSTTLDELAAPVSHAITDGPFGSNLKSDHYTESGPRVIRLQNIGDAVFLDARAHIAQEHFETLRRHEAREGDLVIAMLGERLPRACLVPPDLGPAIVKADCARVRLNSDIVNPKYINWWLNSSGVQRRTTAKLKGVGRPRINLSALRRVKVSLPPMAEQRRIVAKIEELFSDLDAGVAALTRVRANLKRYRASVLKAAVEGRLTAAWRQAHPDTEPADKLLARILAERRAKWEEEQLRKYAEKGKEPPMGWRDKYKPAPSPETERLGERLKVPAPWAIVSASQVSEMSLGKMLDRKKQLTGQRLPYLRNINVRWGWVDTSDLLEMTFKDGELERFGLQAGDVLVCEGGEPGRAAVWTEPASDMKFQKAIHRIRLGSFLRPRLLVVALEHYAKSGLLAKYFTGTTIKHFTGESFAILPLGVPSLAEQDEIIAEVDRRLSVVDAVETEVEHALQRAGRLRQAILKRAFEGGLVPQDPSDEPAAKLLERLRAESEANAEKAAAKKTKRRGRKKVKA